MESALSSWGRRAVWLGVVMAAAVVSVTGAQASMESGDTFWRPERVSPGVERTAALVSAFVERMVLNSGRASEEEKALVEGTAPRTREALRELQEDLAPADRFRFMVAVTRYWLGFDLPSSLAVMREYCPPEMKPGYDEETIVLLDYAYQKRGGVGLLEGIVSWAPRADGAAAEVLDRILPRVAREEPRDLLTALKGQPETVWGRVAVFLGDTGSPEGTYPTLAAIAGDQKDELHLAGETLMRLVAADWPTPPSRLSPESRRNEGLSSHELVLLSPPIEVGGKWHVPAREFCEWLGAEVTAEPDRSRLIVKWRGKSHEWSHVTGGVVFRKGRAYLPIREFGEVFGEPVSLRPGGKVIDFGRPEGRVHAAIPVGWQKPKPPKGLSAEELGVWRLLARADSRSRVWWEPYRIRVVGRWAAAMVHPLNAVTDDAEVILDGRWGAWRVVSLGTTPRAKQLGIPAEVRRELGVWEGP